MLPNDEMIKKIVKEDTNYEIKTTASEILNTYQYQKSITKNLAEANKKEKNKKALFISIPILSTLVAIGASLIVVFNIYGKDINNPGIQRPDDNNFIGVSDSNALSSELITFSSFTNFSNTNLSSLNRFSRNDRNNNYTLDDFKTIISEFDDTYFGIDALFNMNNIKINDLVFEGTVNNNFYKYKSEIIYSDNNEIIGVFYYNDLTKFTHDDETNSYLEALYIIDNNEYSVFLNQEIENERNESETELEAIFINNNDNNDVYKVKKESEIDGRESEDCYAYEKFNDIESLKNEDNYIYKIEYSVEKENNKEEIELEITRKENRQEKVYSFQNITRINDNKYTFYCEYESETTNQEIEFNVVLDIVGDKRIYQSGDLSVEF